jgi:hypothetical protein
LGVGAVYAFAADDLLPVAEKTGITGRSWLRSPALAVWPGVRMTILSILTIVVLCAALPTAAVAGETAYAGLPFGGRPQAVPGTIEVEAYDTAAGEGVAFSYRGGGKSGPFRATPDAIGIGVVGDDHVHTDGSRLPVGGFYLGWTQDGQWMRYTVEVAEAGVYVIGGRFAAGGTGSQLELRCADGSGSAFAIPSSEGFQPQVEVYHVWHRLDDLAEITLPAGRQVLTLTLVRAVGLNVDHLTLRRVR